MAQTLRLDSHDIAEAVVLYETTIFYIECKVATDSYIATAFVEVVSPSSVVVARDIMTHITLSATSQQCTGTIQNSMNSNGCRFGRPVAHMSVPASLPRW